LKQKFINGCDNLEEIISVIAVPIIIFLLIIIISMFFRFWGYIFSKVFEIFLKIVKKIFQKTGDGSVS